MTHELLLTTYEIVVLSMVIRRYANHYGDLYYRGRWCGVRGRVRHRSSPNFNLNQAASNKWLRRFPLTICFRLVIQNDHLNREARDVIILSYDQGFQINDEEFCCCTCLIRTNLKTWVYTALIWPRLRIYIRNFKLRKRRECCKRGHSSWWIRQTSRKTQLSFYSDR